MTCFKQQSVTHTKPRHPWRPSQRNVLACTSVNSKVPAEDQLEVEHGEDLEVQAEARPGQDKDQDHDQDKDMLEDHLKVLREEDLELQDQANTGQGQRSGQ